MSYNYWGIPIYINRSLNENFCEHVPAGTTFAPRPRLWRTFAGDAVVILGELGHCLATKELS